MRASALRIAVRQHLKPSWIEKLGTKRQPEGCGKHRCLIWGMALTDRGYPMAHIGGRKGPVIRVHRWLWCQMNPTLHIGGLDLDHLCRRRACIEPTHVEPCEHMDNLLRSDFWQKARNGHIIMGMHSELSDEDLAALADGAWLGALRR